MPKGENFPINYENNDDSQDFDYSYESGFNEAPRETIKDRGKKAFEAVKNTAAEILSRVKNFANNLKEHLPKFTSKENEKTFEEGKKNEECKSCINKKAAAVFVAVGLTIVLAACSTGATEEVPAAAVAQPPATTETVAEAAEEPAETLAVEEQAGGETNGEETADPYVGELENGVHYNYSGLGLYDVKINEEGRPYLHSDLKIYPYAYNLPIDPNEDLKEQIKKVYTWGPEYLAPYAHQFLSEDVKKELGLISDDGTEMTEAEIEDIMDDTENMMGGEFQSRAEKALDDVFNDEHVFIIPTTPGGTYYASMAEPEDPLVKIMNPGNVNYAASKMEFDANNPEDIIYEVIYVEFISDGSKDGPRAKEHLLGRISGPCGGQVITDSVAPGTRIIDPYTSEVIPPEEKPPEGEPKNEEPKKEEPKKDEPKKEEPKKEEPKKDEPKKEEPKKEEPKEDEPKKDEPAPEWGKTGDPHAGGDVAYSDYVDPRSGTTKKENDDTNRNNRGYTDDNKARPGSSSDNGTTGGFSDIIIEDADVSDGRLTGGYSQGGDETAGDNPYYNEEETNAGLAIDEVGNNAQEEAQDTKGTGENNYSNAGEEEAVANGDF